jgi:hypothetical protein
MYCNPCQDLSQISGVQLHVCFWSHVGIFDPALLTVAPLTFSLVQLPPPLPCLNKYTVYTFIVCQGGGEWSSGPQTDKHLPHNPLQVNFLRDDILHCLLWVFSLHGYRPHNWYEKYVQFYVINCRRTILFETAERSNSTATFQSF